MVEPRVDYHPDEDVLEIEGVRYSAEMFRELGWRADLLTKFQLIERNDGVITLLRISENG